MRLSTMACRMLYSLMSVAAGIRNGLVLVVQMGRYL
jgi:hypothetical protein